MTLWSVIFDKACRSQQWCVAAEAETLHFAKAKASLCGWWQSTGKHYRGKLQQIAFESLHHYSFQHQSRGWLRSNLPTPLLCSNCTARTRLANVWNSVYSAEQFSKGVNDCNDKTEHKIMMTNIRLTSPVARPQQLLLQTTFDVTRRESQSKCTPSHWATCLAHRNETCKVWHKCLKIKPRLDKNFSVRSIKCMRSCA
jgi:hypothetical protein